jgi:hypothetical protein
MDPLTLIVGALLALVFFALGRKSVQRQALLPGDGTPPPKPICGCNHGLHQHDLKSSKCHYKFLPCDCLRYTGPLPAEEFIAQQLLPPVEGV